MSEHDFLSVPEQSTKTDPVEDADPSEQERLARMITRNHLAVFALASSVAGIEWVDSVDHKHDELAAMLHQENRPTVRFPGGHWLVRPGTVMTASGYTLQARLEIDRWYPDAARVLPSEFDIPILGEDSFSTIISSKINIERPSHVSPGVLSKLGITAVHAVKYSYEKPRLETLNTVAGTDAFRPLFRILEETSSGTADYSVVNESIASDNSNIRPSSIRDAHYATPNDLEVPDAIMGRARSNFAVLAARIRLLADPQIEP